MTHKIDSAFKPVSIRALLEILKDSNGNVLHEEILNYYYNVHNCKRNGKDIAAWVVCVSDPQFNWSYRIRFNEPGLRYLKGKINQFHGTRVLARSDRYKFQELQGE